MLHIGVDARPLNFPHSGIGQYLGALLEILLPGAPDDVRWHLYCDRPLPENRIWRDSVMRCGNNSSPLMSTVFAQRHFGRWAKKDQLDVFWSPRHQLPLTVPKTIPCVVTQHDLVFVTHPHTMTRAGRLLERLLTPPSLKKARAIITTSQYVLGELEQYSSVLAAKTTAIPLSSNIAEVIPGYDDLPPPTGPFMLFCGSSEPRKNLDRLLRSLAALKVKPDAPPHRLIIATGGGWSDASTQALIERYQAFVEVRANVSEAQKAALLRDADFLVLPSLTEGYGIPLVEAQKLGRPILTANTGAMPEVACDAALYVNPYEEQSISDALLALCTDPQLRKRLADNARSQAASFSWLASAQATLAVLKQAAS